jgi:hypothetical protein
MHQEVRVDEGGHHIVWTVIRADLARVEPVIRSPWRKRLESFASDPDVKVAVNGGFYEPDESPSGWLVSEGVSLAPANRRGGSGSFVVRDGRAEIAPVSPTLPVSVPEFALQCGPRLVEPGGALGIRADDGKRAARTVLCLREGGYELDIVLAWTRNGDRDGPTLLQMARWLMGGLLPSDPSGCEAALNLDGGPSTGIYLRDDEARAHKPFGKVPFALVLRERRGVGSSP